jgi:hypothetical protein
MQPEMGVTEHDIASYSDRDEWKMPFLLLNGSAKITNLPLFENKI